MKAVADGDWTITEVTNAFEVTRKIPDDSIKGCIVHGKKTGVNTACSARGREVTHCIPAKHGKLQLSTHSNNSESACAWTIAKRSNTDCRLSWSLFKQRQRINTPQCCLPY